jgi:hypothetical protein
MIICVIICIIRFKKNVYIVVTISCNVCLFWWYFALFLASRMHVMQFLKSECIAVKVKVDKQSSSFLTLL